MNNHLLKGDEVAERLNVIYRQAFALMGSGEIPTIRFGDRYVRVRSDDLEFFIDNSSVSSTKNFLFALTASKTKQVTPTFNSWFAISATLMVIISSLCKAGSMITSKQKDTKHGQLRIVRKYDGNSEDLSARQAVIAILPNPRPYPAHVDARDQRGKIC